MRQILRRIMLIVVSVVALLVAGLGSLPAQSVRAAGTVTTCADSGAGSLRAAIAGGGAVTFAAGLNCTGASAIVLTTGTLTIVADTTIDATGATIVVDGGCTANCGTPSPTGGVQVFH